MGQHTIVISGFEIHSEMTHTLERVKYYPEAGDGTVPPDVDAVPTIHVDALTTCVMAQLPAVTPLECIARCLTKFGGVCTVLELAMKITARSKASRAEFESGARTPRRGATLQNMFSMAYLLHRDGWLRMHVFVPSSRAAILAVTQKGVDAIARHQWVDHGYRTPIRSMLGARALWSKITGEALVLATETLEVRWRWWVDKQASMATTTTTLSSHDGIALGRGIAPNDMGKDACTVAPTVTEFLEGLRALNEKFREARDE